MRVDLVFEPFYVLSSLWGILPGRAVCPASPAVLSRAAHEAVSVAGPQASARVTAFVGVNVVPMDTEQVLADQTVLIERGVITALGPADKIQVPAGAVRIDGRGKYLMPGLADMHGHQSPPAHVLAERMKAPTYEGGDASGTHEGTYEGRARRFFSYLASGVTTFRALENAADDPYMSRRFRAARTAKVNPVLTPRLYIAPWMPEFETRLPRPDSVAVYLTAYKAAGYDYILIPKGNWLSKLHSKSSRDSVIVVLDSLVAASRRLGIPLAEHHSLTSDLIERIAASGAIMSAEHLGGGLSGKASKATPGGGLWITLTLNCGGGGDPQHLKALQDAGVKFLLGPDNSAQQRSAPSRTHDELGLMVRTGLTPYQALLTGTRNVAEYLGRLDSSGTVAVGKWADLVLLSGNPLQDIRHAREPAGVMIGGRWLDRAMLDRELISAPQWAPLPSWLVVELTTSIFSQPPLLVGQLEQEEQVRRHLNQLSALSDSLAVAKPKSRAYEHLLRRLAVELGGLHKVLTPEQRPPLDAAARVWMRAQDQQGYRVTVPGVPLVP